MNVDTIGREKSPRLRLRCAELWGGTDNAVSEVSSETFVASLFANAAVGGRGGDLYYFSVCDNNAITRVALADVMGHGEAVSTVSQWLYDALASRMNSLESGHSVLTELNRLANDRGIAAMTTAAVVSFDSASAEMYFSYAGHPPLLVQRRGSGSWIPAALESSTKLANLPLGALERVTYDQQRVRLEPGDRVLLYSDGLIDAPASDGSTFGQRGLQAALARAGEPGLAELRDSVIASLREHTGGSLIHDDVTLLAIEVR